MRPALSLLLLCGCSSVAGGPSSQPDMGPQPDACFSVSAQAMLTRPPVDVLFVIDNSASMKNEILSVQQNLNKNFAEIIAGSGLDYRVILLSRHGSAEANQSICIDPPLSGNETCAPPATKPTNGERFFHYSTEIASHDSLSRILATYNIKDPSGQAPGGWSDWLRRDSFKFIVEITDDGTDMPAEVFDERLLGLTPARFGSADDRRYIFHTLSGFAANTPPTKPYQPEEGLVTERCRDQTGKLAIDAGLEYQRLSKLTGGLRFPVCEYPGYDAVFRAVAEGVTRLARVSCEFELPTAPKGQAINLQTITVHYQPGDGGAEQAFKKVAGPAECVAGAFYLSGQQIVLCKDACQGVRADDKAGVRVRFDCLTLFG